MLQLLATRATSCYRDLKACNLQRLALQRPRLSRPVLPSFTSPRLIYKPTRWYTELYLDTEAGKSETIEEDANALWEAQEGYVPSEEPENRGIKGPIVVEKALNEERRPRLVTGDAPESWRPTIFSKRSHSPRAISKKRQPTYYKREERVEAKKAFDKLFVPEKVAFEDDELGSEFEDFDVDQWSDQIRIIQSHLLTAYRKGDVAQGESQFQYALRLQQRIPPNLGELHQSCRLIWMTMMNLYVDYGEYEQLKSFMEKYDITYGQHEADRALLTFRHFYSQGLFQLANNFWNDANKVNILDERAYADAIQWMYHSGLDSDARATIDNALARSDSDSTFVLTVYFYNAAIQFSVQTLNASLLQQLVTRMLEKAPFGLGILSFVTWTHRINNIIIPRRVRDTTTPKKDQRRARYTPNSSQKTVVQLQPLLDIQQELMTILRSAMDSLAIKVDDALRDELIRYEIMRAKSIDEISSAISKYTITPSPQMFDNTVESLIIHQSFADLRKLFETPQCLGEGLRPTAATSRFVSRWINRMLDPSTPSFAPPSPTSAQLERPLVRRLDMHSPALELFEIVYLLPLPYALRPAPRTLSNILLHILAHIGNIEPRLRPHSQSKHKRAINRILEPLFARAELGIPDDTQAPHAILSGLFDYGFPEQAKNFAYYCQHRLSGSALTGTIALRMTQLEKMRKWDEMDSLWQFTLNRRHIRRPHLLHVYAQSLLHRRPFNQERAISFIASLINRSIDTTPIIHYEALQMVYRLRPEGFDVPAFWALERVRRSLRSPLDSRTASLVSMILTSYGDIFIHTGASVRLHADFDSYITKAGNLHTSLDLQPHKIREFEDAFDRWYSIFEQSVPAENQIVSPHILPENQYCLTEPRIPHASIKTPHTPL